jgi:hypothetical protein
MSETPKPPTKAQIKKMLNAKALEAVHEFVDKYFNIPEGNDAEHDANETNLIKTLLDLFDPEEENPPTA